MRSISLFALFFMTLQCAIAQHPFDESLNPLKDVLPPSPTAAGLGVYGEIPVSLHTGIPNVSIPLTALSSGTLSVPISLSYHGGGNQVDAISSWVGLGWSLNAGGVISRTVNGLPDDEQYGYWNYPIPEDFLSTGVTHPATAQQASDANDYLNYLKGATEGKRDGQPDQFNFNINGYSGRFYIENTGDATNPLVVRLIPHQDIKIELNKPGSTLDGFTLITPDGVKYMFGGVDQFNTECVERSKTNSSGHNCGRNYNLPVITSWYLREIKAPNGIDQINFAYGKHELTYEAGVSRTMATVIDQYQTGSVASPCPSGTQSSYCVRDLRVEGIHLERIDANTGGVIVFISTNGREDLTTGGVRLTEVRQYGLKAPSNYIRKYIFTIVRAI